MAERYSTRDIESLAAHLTTVLARHAEGHATACNVADVALGWAADHGVRPEGSVRRQVAADIRDMSYELGDAGWKHLEDKAAEADYPREWITSYRERDDF